MTRVYLVRHGEAEGNLFRRAQGQYDGHITSLGEKQIALLTGRFRDVPLQAVYSSDLSRSVQTAQGILRAHPELEMKLDKRLREVHLGVWEDQPWGNVEHEGPEKLYYFNNVPEKWSVPGSESFDALTSRLREVILELAAKHEGGEIALCSHGMAIRAILLDTLRREGRDVNPGHGDNTSVSILEVEGEHIHAAVLNDASHVPTELSTLARQEWWKHEGSGELNNMRIEPLRLPEEKEIYTDAYADAWRFAHGNLEGFAPEPYYALARHHAQAHPRALVKVLRGEELAGVVELDTQRISGGNTGWVVLLYLTEKMRSRGLAVQLLGHAVSVYRSMGRSAIRLHVSTENKKGIAFYERNGFRQVGIDAGVSAPLLLMERPI